VKLYFYTWSLIADFVVMDLIQTSSDIDCVCAAVHGVCYGMVGDNLPSRSDVVQLYKSRNIHAMRIYNPDQEALAALRGSGIFLILDVGGLDEVQRLARDPSYAAGWVRSNVQAYYPDVLIRYIAVGNEVPAGDTGVILPAMQNVHNALASANLSSSIKVSTAVRFDVITNSFPPSSGVFRDPSGFVPIARFLDRTGAPFLANVYPYFAYKDDRGQNIRLNYATLQPGTTVRDNGNGLNYTSLFDAMVDSIYAALEKAGTPNVRVVVSESGWPSAGGFGASVDNARSYNQGLIDHIRNGTPKRSGAIETYIFAMFNEKKKPGDEVERNFGLFFPNKQPVYPTTFPN
uniref:Glucan endo-1,3-beta-D-glucosidase n=1 Tax=Aegilops tauschii subsp. strangulata TaxID=200361 RepID=A0A453GSI2_AEGTS